MLRAVVCSVLLLLLLPACGSSDPERPSALSRDEMIEACARVDACVPDAYSASLTWCASLPATSRVAMAASYRCVNRVGGDCAAVLACLAGPAPVAPCQNSDPPRCLDDKHYWQCQDGTPVVWDCGEDRCLTGVGQEGRAYCGIELCEVFTYDMRCRDDERWVHCQQGVAVSEVCPVGTRCQGEGECVGTGAPCDPFASSCEGSTTVGCFAGHEARRDCSVDDFDATCAIDEHHNAVCQGTGDECAPAQFVDRCSGARLEYCRDGRVASVDCTALGFASCNAGESARCSEKPEKP